MSSPASCRLMRSRLPRGGHRHKRGHGFDSVPQVLQPDVLVLGVLVVVVVGDGYRDSHGAEIIGNDRQR